MADLRQSFARHYTAAIQLCPFQAQAIGAAILSRSPGCRLLIFGVGNDSALWLALNDSGETLFLETQPDWAAKIQQALPGIRIAAMPTYGLTVANSPELPEATLEALPMPTELHGAWDVILVDAPPGYEPHLPGRTLSTYWAARLAGPRTHVFQHDHERPLERRVAERFLLPADRAGCVEVAHSTGGGTLLWRMGRPLP